MRNKGIIKVFTISMAVVCLYQLFFTFKTWTVEKEARKFSEGDYTKEAVYLDSMSNEFIYNFLGLRKYTYKECKEREINLGLDLKGGMNVILEVSVSDVVRALANNHPDPSFQQALVRAAQMQLTSQDDFITLFGRAFREIDPNAQLAAIFRTVDMGNKIKFDASNDDVLTVLRHESNSAIDVAFNIVRTRIDRFGVVQPNIQQLETKGRILVELPGVKEPERVLKLLQGSANLEFWETYDNTDIYPFLFEANNRLKEIEALQNSATTDSIATAVAATTETPELNAEIAPQDSTANIDLLERLTQETTAVTDSSTLLQNAREQLGPLFSILQPSAYQGQLAPGPVIGSASIKDIPRVKRYLEKMTEDKIFPNDLRLLWGVKPIKDGHGNETDIYNLYAIKETGRDGRAPLGGDVITNTSADFNQRGGSRAEVSMSMNSEGALTWARLTKDNIGRCIAIVLDDNVYSAPIVNTEITGGRSVIQGDFSINEATDLANVLKSGKLPAKTTVMSNEVVGPTLGKESIRAGMMSFIIAITIVMVYLMFYYSRAGVVTNVCLLVNMFFLMGVMASLGAVLTLPGIAGIVLTFGMANDANIIIYERIREELRAGKGVRLAVADGYKNAYSAIIDANVTTVLVGIVLWYFGTGPIQGFATTLVLGILTSMFCAILISRLIFEWMLNKNANLKFSIPMTEDILRNTKYDFIGMRKKAYIASIGVIGIGLLSIVFQGFNYGIDFTGGRSYTVRYADAVNTLDLQSTLRKAFDDERPEVKTFGADKQVKITTSYLMSEEQNPEFTQNIDSIIISKMYDSSLELKLIPEDTDVEKFSLDNLMNRQKVGASIAGDIKRNAVIAVLLSLLVMFFYIFFRFRWQFGAAAVVSLAHNALVMIGLYSLLWKIAPFSLEIDQHFIAAILTVIGYSINDTVVIFDRIREWITLYPKRPIHELYNSAVNSTLSRTLNTAFTTLVVLFIIIIFGGEMLRGFAFAMFCGIGVGVYSSIFTATPFLFELITRKSKKDDKKIKG